MFVRFLMIALLATGFALAQDEGGGGGGGGRGGGGGGMRGGGDMGGMPRFQASTLDRIADSCKLSKEQKKDFKTILDAAGKESESLRKQIPQAREAIGAAVRDGKSAEEIHKLVETQGAATAQMTQLELKTFAALYQKLDADQKKVGGQRLFNSMLGLFLKKNWND